MFVFLTMLTLYPDCRLAGFAKATKTSGVAKVYWRRLHSKRSLPVLEWSSESKYFERFNFFVDNIYRPRATTLPLAAHAWHGVINLHNRRWTPEMWSLLYKSSKVCV